MLLFCYGTLKSGYRNNHYVCDGELLGEFDTLPRYRLFENGIFPMMVEDPNHGYAVTGEVWDIDDDYIDEIDMHEVLYDRKEVEIDGFDEPVYTYIYFPAIWGEQECYGMWG